MSEIGLIATDLDGTLIARAQDFHLYPAFREKLEELRRDSDVLLAICTGRSLKSFHRFFTPMRMMGITPDFVIVKHAYIYGCGRFGYVPHVFWNMRTRYALWLNKLRVGRAISQWHRVVVGNVPRSRTIRRTRHRLYMSFDSRQAAARAAEILKERAEKFKRFQVFEYRLEVDVRPVPFMKGFAVSQLARHIGLSSRSILTVGNGHNDISMLDPNVAGMYGCPSNSEPEVVEKVNKRGGHVASAASLGGVMETIDSYRNGTVNSELPEGWVSPSVKENPTSGRRRKGEQDSSRARGWIYVVGVYAVLVVFANYGLLPFSEVIAKPFYLMVNLVKAFLSSL